MTPRELEFLYDLIERVSEEVYRLGYEDAKAGKPLKTEGFRPSKASRLVIKTNLIKLTQKR
jgi:hypothetical protein